MIKPIPANYKEFLNSSFDEPFVMYVASRDRDLNSESIRSWGGRMREDGNTAEVYLSRSLADKTLANLEHNGQIAHLMIRLADLESLQLKGRFISAVDPSEEAEKIGRKFHDNYVSAVAEYGFSKEVQDTIVASPLLVITYKVESAFLQSPGPNAGNRICMEEK